MTLRAVTSEDIRLLGESQNDQKYLSVTRKGSPLPSPINEQNHPKLPSSCLAQRYFETNIHILIHLSGTEYSEVSGFH